MVRKVTVKQTRRMKVKVPKESEFPGQAGVISHERGTWGTTAVCETINAEPIFLGPRLVISDAADSDIRARSLWNKNVIRSRVGLLLNREPGSIHYYEHLDMLGVFGSGADPEFVISQAPKWRDIDKELTLRVIGASALMNVRHPFIYSHWPTGGGTNWMMPHSIAIFRSVHPRSMVALGMIPSQSLQVHMENFETGMVAIKEGYMPFDNVWVWDQAKRGFYSAREVMVAQQIGMIGIAKADPSSNPGADVSNFLKEFRGVIGGISIAVGKPEKLERSRLVKVISLSLLKDKQVRQAVTARAIQLAIEAITNDMLGMGVPLEKQRGIATVVGPFDSEMASEIQREAKPTFGDFKVWVAPAQTDNIYVAVVRVRGDRGDPAALSWIYDAKGDLKSVSRACKWLVSLAKNLDLPQDFFLKKEVMEYA